LIHGRKITRLPRRWQICCRSAGCLAPTVQRRKLPQGQSCDLFAPKLLGAGSDPRFAKPILLRCMLFKRFAVGGSNRTLGRRDASGRAPRNSFSADEFGYRRFTIRFGDFVPRSLPIIVRTSSSAPYLVANPRATRAGFHRVFRSSNSVCLFGIPPRCLAHQEARETFIRNPALFSPMSPICSPRSRIRPGGSRAASSGGTELAPTVTCASGPTRRG